MSNKSEAQFNTIESMEKFPLHERLFMNINLQGLKLSIFQEGREAKDDEVGTALWRYHQALNEAEAQIRILLDLVKELGPDDYDTEDYLEKYPDTETNYKLQEAKALLFISMAKGDEKLIGKHINNVMILEEKEASHV
jgi:hypothetical protein